MFTARQLADGRAIVLQPDGLTWEDPFFPDLGEAERFAEELNQWTDSRPTGVGPENILDTFEPETAHNRDSDRLLRIIERMYEPDRKLDHLMHTIRLEAAKCLHQESLRSSGSPS